MSHFAEPGDAFLCQLEQRTTAIALIADAADQACVLQPLGEFRLHTGIDHQLVSRVADARARPAMAGANREQRLLAARTNSNAHERFFVERRDLAQRMAKMRESGVLGLGKRPAKRGTRVVQGRAGGCSAEWTWSGVLKRHGGWAEAKVKRMTRCAGNKSPSLFHPHAQTS